MKRCGGWRARVHGRVCRGARQAHPHPGFDEGLGVLRKRHISGNSILKKLRKRRSHGRSRGKLVKWFSVGRFDTVVGLIHPGPRQNANSVGDDAFVLNDSGCDGRHACASAQKLDNDVGGTGQKGAKKLGRERAKGSFGDIFCRFDRSN